MAAQALAIPTAAMEEDEKEKKDKKDKKHKKDKKDKKRKAKDKKGKKDEKGKCGQGEKRKDADADKNGKEAKRARRAKRTEDKLLKNIIKQMKESPTAEEWSCAHACLIYWAVILFWAWLVADAKAKRQQQ